MCADESGDLKITFHNPNTTEELAKCIIKLMAKQSVGDFVQRAADIQSREQAQL